MKYLVLLSLLLTIGVHAQEAGRVARMVNDLPIDAAALEKALQSSQPLVRAAAARVALVRGVTAVVPALRTRLGSEADPDAARELVRAVVMLGNDDDVAFAASQLPRFPGTIDAAFADAVARTPRALDRYLLHGEKLRNGALSGTLPYWSGSSPHAAAARLLDAGDAASWRSIVDAMTDSGVTLDPGIATAALGSNDERVRNATVWHLLRRTVADPASVPAPVRELATATRDGASVDERFGRELLRRAGGAAAVEQPEFAEWLKKRPVHVSLEPLLTEKERGVRDRMHPLAMPSVPSTPIEEPSFEVPFVLPRGLGATILQDTRCKTGWVGVAVVTADFAGRVQSFDTHKVTADRACTEALGTIARLSLARPNVLGAGRVSPLLVLRVPGQPPCFDETPVRNVASPPGPLPADGDVRAPKVKRRVEPQMPRSLLGAASGSFHVVAEATISSEGCIRDVRLIQQTKFPELNRAVLEALTKWTFTPGTLNGVPVDVLFNLSVNFKL